MDNTTVSGKPIFKYWRDVIFIPCFLAISRTIKLAIEPKTVKFPAIVDNNAKACHKICSSTGM